jgi:hypothetical protein
MQVPDKNVTTLLPAVAASFPAFKISPSIHSREISSSDNPLLLRSNTATHHVILVASYILPYQIIQYCLLLFDLVGCTKIVSTDVQSI